MKKKNESQQWWPSHGTRLKIPVDDAFSEPDSVGIRLRLSCDVVGLRLTHICV